MPSLYSQEGFSSEDFSEVQMQKYMFTDLQTKPASQEAHCSKSDLGFTLNYVMS
jgi:hypothetical protein